MPKLPIRVSRKTLAVIGALIVAALASAGVIQITDNSAPAPAPTATPAATVQLGGPGDATIPAPAPAAAKSAAIGLADHAGARYDAALPPAVARAHETGLDRLARADQLPITLPDAAPTVPGCRSEFVRNFSSRGGVAPHELVAHYTVSRNIPGWGDVNAVVHEFDTPAFAASSDFVIDGEGHCAYIVRDTDKAWTQASANPFSVSIEFIAMGDEGSLPPAALAKGGRVFALEARKWHIPVQLGKVVNCLPVVPGVVDHAMLGLCGGGHHDLRPLNGTHVPPQASEDTRALAPLLAAIRVAMPKPVPTGLASLTPAERSAAAQLALERRIAARHGGWDKIDPLHLGHAIAAKTVLAKADATVLAWAGKSGWTPLRHARHDELTKIIRG
jgi:hypothetical protein